MKKAIILFIIFFLIDMLLFIILGNYINGKLFYFWFLPAMFLEIAIYGSFILYEVSKKRNDDD